MFERHWDLAAVAGYAVLATAAVWDLHPGGLGGLVLAPLLVICPGYALICAIENHRPDPLELVVTTVALSFAAAVLGGLLLNALRLGLTAHTWSTLLLGVTVAATAVAARRRVGADDLAPARSIRIRAAPAFAIATICALMTAASFIAVHSQLVQDHRESTTGLGVLTSKGRSTLRISVANADAGPRRYRIRIDAGGMTMTTLAVSLASGAHWAANWRVPRSAVGPITIKLFNGMRSTVALRTLSLGSLRRKASNT